MNQEKVIRMSSHDDKASKCSQHVSYLAARNERSLLKNVYVAHVICIVQLWLWLCISSLAMY